MERNASYLDPRQILDLFTEISCPQIGLMRSGHLLAEESPRALLTMYNCASLEDVFLKLSRKQGQYSQPPTELNISNNISLVRRCFAIFGPVDREEEIPREFISTIFSQASLNWGKKNEPVYVTEESGVVGLNFHQSKEVLIHDSTNGVGNHYDVRILERFSYVYNMLFSRR